MIDSLNLTAIVKIISDCENMLFLLTGSKIKIKLEILAESISKKDAIKLQLQNRVCSETGLSWSVIAGKSRKREVVDARKIYSIISYGLLDNTFEEIGNDMGGRDHSTIMNLNKKGSFLKRISPTINKIRIDLNLK